MAGNFNAGLSALTELGKTKLDEADSALDEARQWLKGRVQSLRDTVAAIAPSKKQRVEQPQEQTGQLAALPRRGGRRGGRRAGALAVVVEEEKVSSPPQATRRTRRGAAEQAVETLGQTSVDGPSPAADSGQTVAPSASDPAAGPAGDAVEPAAAKPKPPVRRPGRRGKAAAAAAEPIAESPANAAGLPDAPSTSQTPAHEASVAEPSTAEPTAEQPTAEQAAPEEPPAPRPAAKKRGRKPKAKAAQAQPEQWPLDQQPADTLQTPAAPATRQTRSRRAKAEAPLQATGASSPPKTRARGKRATRATQQQAAATVEPRMSQLATSPHPHPASEAEAAAPSQPSPAVDEAPELAMPPPHPDPAPDAVPGSRPFASNQGDQEAPAAARSPAHARQPVMLQPSPLGTPSASSPVQQSEDAAAAVEQPAASLAQEPVADSATPAPARVTRWQAFKSKTTAMKARIAGGGQAASASNERPLSRLGQEAVAQRSLRVEALNLSAAKSQQGDTPATAPPSTTPAASQPAPEPPAAQPAAVPALTPVLGLLSPDLAACVTQRSRSRSRSPALRSLHSLPRQHPAPQPSPLAAASSPAAPAAAPSPQAEGAPAAGASIDSLPEQHERSEAEVPAAASAQPVQADGAEQAPAGVAAAAPQVDAGADEAEPLGLGRQDDQENQDQESEGEEEGAEAPKAQGAGGGLAANLVSTIRSFLPAMTRPDASAGPAGGKKNVKVKALEAAEAARRKEEARAAERARQHEALQRQRAERTKRAADTKAKQEEEAVARAEEVRRKEAARKRREEEAAAARKVAAVREREEKQRAAEERARRKAEDAKRKLDAEKEWIGKAREMEARRLQRQEDDRKRKESPGNTSQDGSAKRQKAAAQHTARLPLQQRPPNNAQLAAHPPAAHKLHLGGAHGAAQEPRPAPNMAAHLLKDPLAKLRTQHTGASPRPAAASLQQQGDLNGGSGSISSQRAPSISSPASGHRAGLQSYEISPYRSEMGDSDEDESDSPKKPIPDWATVHMLRLAIANQRNKDPDEIFSTKRKTCSLDQVFSQSTRAAAAGKERAKGQRDLTRRSSSGNWIEDRVTWKEEMSYKKAMGYLS